MNIVSILDANDPDSPLLRFLDSPTRTRAERLAANAELYLRGWMHTEARWLPPVPDGHYYQTLEDACLHESCREGDVWGRISLKTGWSMP